MIIKNIYIKNGMYVGQVYEFRTMADKCFALRKYYVIHC